MWTLVTPDFLSLMLNIINNSGSLTVCYLFIYFTFYTLTYLLVPTNWAVEVPCPMSALSQFPEDK